MPAPGGIGRLQRPVKRVVGPLIRRLLHLDVSGVEHVPETGPAVLCPNHLAAIDSFLLPSVLAREVIFVGKAEYLDDWKTRELFPALGMIPIDRRGGEHATAALDAARSVLADGGLFAIYPEGTRSRDGRLHRGHTGAARLAVEAGAPLIPVGLVGTDQVQPVGATFPRLFRRVSITFGEPIDVAGHSGRLGDQLRYRQLTDELMFEIQRITGQEYDPTYATSKAAAPDGATADGQGPGRGPAEVSSSEVLATRPLGAAAS